MMIMQKTPLIVVLIWMTSNASAGDELSLQNLRFFFTPEQRSPKLVIPAEVVESPPTTFATPGKDIHPPTIHYVGEIRSGTKKRLFWKKGESKYFSIVPEAGK